MKKVDRILSTLFYGFLGIEIFQGSSFSIEPGRWVPILHYQYQRVDHPQWVTCIVIVFLIGFALMLWQRRRAAATG